MFLIVHDTLDVVFSIEILQQDILRAGVDNSYIEQHREQNYFCIYNHRTV